MKYSTDLQSNKHNIHSDIILVRLKGDGNSNLEMSLTTIKLKFQSGWRLKLDFINV